MPHRRHGFSGCSHKGYGAHCHRCAQADKLEAKLPKNIASEDFAKKKAEIDRLRAPAKKKGSYTPPVTDPMG